MKDYILLKPKISIITVCYNSENTISECINSVIAQTYQNIEYILVDGGSTDATLRIAGKYETSIDQILMGPDKGISDAFNKGINSATGEWLIFLNSDDYFVNERAVESIIEFLKADICISRVIYESPSSKFSIKRKFTIFKFKNLIGYAQPGMIFSKKIFDYGYRFSLEYKLAMDTELVARAIHENFKVIDIPTSITVMRLGGISSIDRSGVILEGIKIRTKYFGVLYGINYRFLRKFFKLVRLKKR